MKIKFEFIIIIVLLVAFGAYVITHPDIDKTPGNNPITNYDRTCSYDGVFEIIEKSDILGLDGKPHYVIAAHYQSEPVLLDMGSFYDSVQKGDTYQITFEGDLTVLDIQRTPEEYIVSKLDVANVIPVEAANADTPIFPLNCK